MSYKVFFVEDEIVTREGIRDNVDWKANGFEFCGEAPDGEIALPLLELSKPDVLITDIKMPFMDGLQLCHVVRERMPDAKIVILSGHDEFEYAQKAIQLGVSEYLLKPVSVQDLHAVLQKIAAQITHERQEQESLQRLRDQVRESQAVLRERFLHKLLMGAVSSSDAIDQGQRFGIDLVARYYLVVVLKIGHAASEPFDYRQYEPVRRAAVRGVADNPDVFMLELDWEELVLIIKGNTLEYVQEERLLLLERIERQMQETGCRFSTGVGSAKERITELYQSLIEALVNLQSGDGRTSAGFDDRVDKAELAQVDKSAVENYLRSGVKDDFDSFFDTFIRPFWDTVLGSQVIKNYIFMDIVLATAKFVNELGGNVDVVMPELGRLGTILAGIRTIEQIREQAQNILVSALVFRDSRTGNQYVAMLRQAKEYLDRHYVDPELSLNQVAATVNLSPCHFSAVFSQQNGQTFKEYLTELRIHRAKELLRTTILRSFEIADQIGYNDPHYFSYVFRKTTGLSPKEFRLQAQAG
jgi:two-component system, response regulator YesN